MSKTLANIMDEVSLEMGDYLHETATTAINNDNNLVATGLANLDGGTTNNFWKDWWVVITSNANDGEIRKVAAYTASTKTLATMGNAWTDDSANLATFELHKHDPTKKKNAINIVSRKLYPRLHRKITDLSVITGNILPDFSWWTSSSAHKFWSTSTGTLAKTSPGSGFTRGGRFSMKFTDSGGGDEYVSLHSDNYPRLLGLRGATVSSSVWAYPVDTDDDPEIEIHTLQGTDTGFLEQTLTSKTETELGYYQIVTLPPEVDGDSMKLSPTLDTVEIRLRCVTASKNVYFQEPRLIGNKIYDYMLPELLQNGQITWVRRQITGTQNNRPADDVGWNEDYVDIFGWSIVTENINGTNYQFIRTPSNIPQGYRLELQGFAPLEDNLSLDTDTITIDDPYTQLLVLEAVKQTYKMLRGQGSSFTSDAYETEIARIDFDISRLGNLRMGQPAQQLRVRR